MNSLKNKLKGVLVVFSMLLSLSVLAEEASEDLTKNHLPTELFKDAVKCAALTYSADTVEAGIRYSYYKDAAKIVGLYILRMDERIFKNVYNANYKNYEKELAKEPSSDKLEFFNTVCERSVLKFYLDYVTDAAEFGEFAMSYVQLHMNSVKVINEE